MSLGQCMYVHTYIHTYDDSGITNRTGYSLHFHAAENSHFYQNRGLLVSD